MTKEEAEGAYRQASDSFRRGDYEGALTILNRIECAFPNNPKIMKARTECESRIRESLSRLPYDSARTASTREQVAFLIGQALTIVFTNWSPRWKLTELNTAILQLGLGLMDVCLQQLNMEFPFSGKWPKTTGRIAEEIESMFEDQPKSVNRAFQFGFQFFGFQHCIDVWASPSTRMNSPQFALLDSCTRSIGSLLLGQIRDISGVYSAVCIESLKELVDRSMESDRDFARDAGQILVGLNEARESILKLFAEGGTALPPRSSQVSDDRARRWMEAALTRQWWPFGVRH